MHRQPWSRRLVALLTTVILALTACGGDTAAPVPPPPPPPPPAAIATIVAGGGHTCGLTTSGQVYCWGLGVQGQLGDNTLLSRLVPVPIVGGLVFP